MGPPTSIGGLLRWLVMNQTENRRSGQHIIGLLRFALLAVLVAGCGADDPVGKVRELESQGRFDEATAELRVLLGQGRKEPEVYFLYGRALGASGRPSLALWPLERAMESPDWVVRAGLQLAANALQIADYKLTDEAAGRVISVEPENVAALILRSLARSQTRRRYEDALADAERALELDPDVSDAMLARGIALLGLGRVDEAGEAIDRLETHFRDAAPGLAGSERFCAVRAVFAKEKGDTERADELFGKCLEEYPASFLVVDAAVAFYDDRGQSDRALEIVRNASEKAPLVRAFHVSLALRLQQAGQSDAAEEILRAATQAQQPELAAEAWTDLAGFLLQNERLDEGIEAFDKAVEVAVEPSAELLFAYADGLVQAKRLDRALEVAERISVRPHRELIRGRVAFERQQWSRAFEHFEEGLRLWPENAVARYLTAACAEKLGDFDRAIQEYRYSIRAGAAESDARLRLARLYVADGSDALALEALRHDLARQPGNLEMALLELEILARLGQLHGSIPARIQVLIGSEEHWGEGVLALARGTRTRSGSEAASLVILGADRLDLTQPRNAPVLRELIVDLVDLGREQEAIERVDAVIRSRPQEGIFHALRGLAISSSHGDPEEARRSFELGLDLDPENEMALRHLGRIAAEAGDTREALSLLERATAASRRDTGALHDAVALLLSLDRKPEAKKQLEAILEREPYDGASALQLAKLRIELGEPPEESLALTRRAVRFGGGDEAKALLKALSRATSDRPKA